MGLFFQLGQMAGPALRKGRWFYQSVTGSEQDVLRAEAEVGRDLAAAMEAELGIEPDEPTRRRIQEIGAKLAGAVADRARSFVFHVWPGGEPNAFALPGGHVFINRPLLEMMGPGDDEAAWVLGHEMGHILRMDPMRRVMTDSIVGAAMKRLPIPGGRLAGAAGSWIKSRGAQLLQSAYSQERELEADKLGAALSLAAGFDPRVAPRMLRRLARLTADRPELPLAAYFSTHPPLERRIAEVQAYLGRKGL
jgi:predicted Zn-dependent protease